VWLAWRRQSAFAAAIWLGAACSGGGGGGGGALGAVETCHVVCDQISNLRCPEALDSSLASDCLSSCLDTAEDESLAQCEDVVRDYYACLAAPGNVVCDGADSFAMIDACDDEYTPANECLGGGCPDTHPIDCGSGCCPLDAPVCGAGTCHVQGGTGGTGGFGGSGGSSGIGGAAGLGGDGGTGGRTGLPQRCLDCIEASCFPQVAACYADRACIDLSVCTASCSDPGCVDGCKSAHPGGLPLYSPLESCATTNCGSVCPSFLAGLG
jgi:hypothetical protein